MWEAAMKYVFEAENPALQAENDEDDDDGADNGNLSPSRLRSVAEEN
jgi:hypothetical protein